MYDLDGKTVREPSAPSDAALLANALLKRGIARKAWFLAGTSPSPPPAHAAARTAAAHSPARTGRPPTLAGFFCVCARRRRLSAAA